MLWTKEKLNAHLDQQYLPTPMVGFNSTDETWYAADVDKNGNLHVKNDDILDEISNKDLMEVLRNLLRVIANPAYVDKSANQLRAQVTGALATLTTVTTVITVTGVTNFGGYPAQQLIIDQNRSAWANVVRGRIS